eukprot:CAMPEP_0201514616 /NCGR_PEP_ID=MMETSP0161_2-20130828/6413_1 /ASSEMBLY_ACC=CAM_ASM_000251 /TAXON_ID=180227 /ORGANISM="Neoparamoeba aestuarina, Strain SoJaBio B1-5/56/2" /LENGTH=90 /DNA_ID=CAMNT_0047911225 /DNA_START=50 /DNA_END=325 /DNA_ORIENTATION=+
MVFGLMTRGVLLGGRGLARQRSLQQGRMLSTTQASRSSYEEQDPNFEAPKVSPTHFYAAEAIGTVLWFWMMYRTYHDGPALIGLKKAWEH